MDKAIFLDRDGTITKSGDHIYKIENLGFVFNAIAGLAKLQEAGYKLIIITNQAGIARGMYTEKDYFAFREEMHKRLKQNGISITAEYFCPHHPEKGIGKYKTYCNCRKPQAGMLEKAAKDFNLNLKKCWMIGDNVSDIAAGRNANCKTVHVLTGETKEPVLYANFVAKNLVEAANYILNNS